MEFGAKEAGKPKEEKDDEVTVFSNPLDQGTDEETG